jgi:hypothetical protein
LSFEEEKEGAKAEADYCSSALKYTYSDDYLVEVDDGKGKLCIEASDHDGAILKKCNDHEDDQIWWFVNVPQDDRRRVFALYNPNKDEFLKRDDDTFTLDDDIEDEDTWFSGPDFGFFKT